VVEGEMDKVYDADYINQSLAVSHSPLRAVYWLQASSQEERGDECPEAARDREDERGIETE
jgi:hypothetical protein